MKNTSNFIRPASWERLRGDGMAHIAPTLLCADLLDLRGVLRQLEQHPFIWHHIDIMDGHFVPNMAFGLQQAAAIKREANLPVAVHLMAENPGTFLDSLAECAIDLLSFHIEVVRNPIRLIQAIQARDIRAGVAINPSTPIEFLRELIPYADLFTVMAVEPGYSGQQFLPGCYTRLQTLKDMIARSPNRPLIEVDGGISFDNASLCVQAGADVLVGGAFTIFHPSHTIHSSTELLFSRICEGR